jgi:peptidoglycan/xylan/chitin deacetylase (PgdA/CDA1 family)
LSTKGIVRAALFCVIFLGLSLSQTALAASRAPRTEGSAKPSATGKASAAKCPAAAYGVHFYAPGGGKTVALTFDDGPGKSTAAILSVLARYKVPATFFNIGENLAARPSLVRAEVKAGYATGNHTWDHPDLNLLGTSRQAAEIDRASAEQRSVSGTVPCAFRPPYGDYDATNLKLAQQRHLGVWLWSVDTEDWMADGSGSSYWVDRVIRLAEEEGGALHHPIVLMHNQPAGNPATVAALPAVIQYFRAHGYRFVAL